jgi:N-acetylmuramoyl-L-alanine amidase
MAFRTRYDVRVIEDGELVTKKRFAAKDAALNFAADKLVRRRRVTIARKRVLILETFQNTEWGIQPHDPWVPTQGPLSMLFIHHSVTKQLPVSATVAEEKQQMRLLDQIAHSRGFNGISYSWAVFPSGRCYEGRGWLVVEAATKDFNTVSDSIALVGNYSQFEMNDRQSAAIRKLVNRAQENGVFVRSGLNVRAHREVAATACPGTKVTDAEIQEIQRAVNA